MALCCDICVLAMLHAFPLHVLLRILAFRLFQQQRLCSIPTVYELFVNVQASSPAVDCRSDQYAQLFIPVTLLTAVYM